MRQQINAGKIDEYEETNKEYKKLKETFKTKTINNFKKV